MVSEVMAARKFFMTLDRLLCPFCQVSEAMIRHGVWLVTFKIRSRFSSILR